MAFPLIPLILSAVSSAASSNKSGGSNSSGGGLLGGLLKPLTNLFSGGSDRTENKAEKAKKEWNKKT